MDTALGSPPIAVSLVSGYMVKEDTTLEVRCHDRTFKSVSILDNTGEKLFSVVGKGVNSWSFRRQIHDKSGQHIFDLRHRSVDVKNRWLVEDSEGKSLCDIEHVSFFTKEHSSMNVTLPTPDHGDVKVEMRQKDRMALTTLVTLQGVTIAEIMHTEDNDVGFANGRDRTAWKVRVAGGTDLALIVTMVLCRAEMAHVWRQ